MRRRFWMAFAFATTAGAVAAACVSDPPASDATGTDGGGSDTSTNGDSTSEGGGCPSDQASCSGKCIDLTQSATNCGNCGKSCFGGTCSGSKCSAYVVAQQPVTGNVAKLATDGTRVFWADVGTFMIAQIGAGGGATITLATSSALNGSIEPELALANGVVAYAYAGGSDSPSVGIAKVDVPNSGFALAHAAGQVTAVSLNTSATHLFYSSKPGMSATFADCAFFSDDAGTCIGVSGGGQFAPESAADDGYLFFDLLSSDSTPEGMYIDQLDAALGPGNPTQFSTGLQVASSLAVDGTWAYWSENDDGGSLYGIHRTLESLPGVTQTPVDVANAPQFATDGANVYYWNGTSIASRPVAGGAETTIAAASALPVDIAVGGGLLVWTDGTTINGIELP